MRDGELTKIKCSHPNASASTHTVITGTIITTSFAANATKA